MHPVAPALSHDETRRLFEALMANSLEGVTITGPDGRIEWVNRAFTAITGYEAGEVLGKTPRVLKSDRHDAAFYRAMWESLAAKGHWEGEIWNRRKTGEAYPEWLRITAVPGAPGAGMRYLGVFQDLTDLKRQQDMLLHEAYHDALTGLPNRNLFLDRLGVALRQARGNGRHVGVVCLDLDRFKTVNDSLGHVVGDIILSEVGTRLGALMRQADTLSRFGGDSFYMLLDALRDPEDAAHVAGRALSSLADPMAIRGEELFVSASVGITICPADGDDPSQLVRNAELAMYRAKDAGRNNFAFFTEDLGERVMGSLRLENDLRKALARGDFVLHYQPRVDIVTSRVVGMEALVRWNAPDGGLRAPATFIPLAEETGLILPLGEWVLEEACRQTARWTSEGLGALTVSVNLSSRQLEQPGLTAKVLAVLQRTGLDPRQLEVEVTESVFLRNFDVVNAALSTLAEAGIGVALDDFGTGYSSLSYLKRLPIKTLKIDKSFVDGLPLDRDDAAIVTSIVSIADNLGMEVVAEGVETMGQLEFLRGLHCCRGFQGYLFARPLPPAEFAQLMADGGVYHFPGQTA